MRIAPPLVAALAAVLCLAAPAAAKAPKRCNGAKALCARSFDRVVLAGAHNAMSAKSLGWQIPNQSIAIRAQLRYGIRALLFDTHYGRPQPGRDGLDRRRRAVTDRHARALPLPRGLRDRGRRRSSPVLRQIAGFLNAHPGNVLRSTTRTT